MPFSPVVFDILVTLAEEPRHGYAILTEIRDRTGEMLRPGSLYRAINRLLDEKLIVEVDGPQDDASERRTYYALTAVGRKRAEAEARRLQAQVQSAQAARLLGRRKL